METPHNTTVIPFNLSFTTAYLIVGNPADAWKTVGEMIDDKRNVLKAGYDAEQDLCNIFVCEDGTKMRKDALDPTDNAILKSFDRAGMHYAPYAACDGDGLTLNVFEAGLLSGRDAEMNLNINKFFLRMNATLFDGHGFVKGSGGKLRDVLMLGRDIAHGMRAFDARNNRYTDVPNYNRKANRVTATALGLVEVERGGTKIMGLTWSEIHRHLANDDKDFKRSVTDLKNKLDGTFEEITNVPGDNMLVATLKGGTTRVQTIQVMTDVDRMTFLPGMKLADAGEVSDDFGGIRRLTSQGVITTDNHNGADTVAFHALDALPKGIKDLASTLN